MNWTLPDGTIARGSAEMKRLCAELRLDWGYYRRRAQKGLARRKGGRRAVRLPAEWRARLEAIFGSDAVFEFTKQVPPVRPAIAVEVNATDTAWAHHMQASARGMCFIQGRVNYLDRATGALLRGNPRGTMIFLFADNEGDYARFLYILRPHGTLLDSWRGAA